MLPKLADLVKTCRELGYEPKPSGKRLSKEDCVKILREHFLPEGGLPYEELTPMLCFAEWNLKEEERDEAWASPEWAAQEKLNGCRLILHFVEGVGIFAHSRTVSRKTFRFQELTDKLLIAGIVPDFSATVDCEVMIEKPVDTRPYTAKGEVTRSTLHSTTAVLHLEGENSRKLQKEQDASLLFHAFDILRWDGVDLVDEPYWGRLEYLAHFIDAAGKQQEWGQFFRFPEVRTEGKREFYQEIVDRGGEGVILKRLDSKYHASSSRPRDGWVKVKRRMEFDAFVTGFLRGEEGTAWRNLVGALEFSVITEMGKKHAIAMCTNLTLATREKISIYDPETDTVTLDPRLFGRVAEVSGQDVTPRSLRLSHATIDRWRPKDGPDSKRPEDCMASMTDLKERSEWVS